MPILMSSPCEFCQRSKITRMLADAQCDGCTAEYSVGLCWKVLLTSVDRRRCSNEAKTWNPLKFAGVPQTHQPIWAVSVPKFTIVWGHVDEILLFNKFFLIVDICLSCEDIADKVVRWYTDGEFFVLYFQRGACSTFQTCILNSH